MAKYRIQAPNGQTYEIEGPEGATDDQVRAEVMRQHPDAAAAASGDAQAIDGGSGAPPSTQPAPQAAPQPRTDIVTPTTGNPQPQYDSNAPGKLADLPDVVSFGDGAGADPARPNLSMTPDQEAHLRSILANGTGSPDEVADQAIKYVQSTGYPLNADGVRSAYRSIVENRAKRGVGGVLYPDPKPLNPRNPSDDRAFFEGAGDGATLGGAGKVLSALDATSTALGMGGNGDPNQSWLNNYRGTLDSYEAQRESDRGEHPYLYTGGALLGGAALPTGIGSAAERAGFEAGANALRSGATREEARILANIAARRAATRRAAGEGAAYGGATGVVSADNIPDAISGGIAGAALGGTLGTATVGIGGRFVRPAGGARGLPLSDGQEFSAAAERQGIDYLPADRPGAAGSQFVTSVANSTLGAIPISEAATKAVETVRGARDRVASAIGDFRTTEGGSADTVFAGQRVQKGVLSAIKGNDAKAKVLYDAIPIAADKPATLGKTREALDYLTNGFESNQALSKLWAENPRLEATRMALLPPNKLTGSPGGNLSWGDLKRFRTIVGEIVGKPGLDADGNQIAAMRKLYGALSEDMRATAETQGGGAVRAFERANGFYNAAQNRKENVFSAILGKNYDNSPEDAYRAVKGWASSQGGDFASVARLVRSLPDSDADILRATIFNSMGKVSKGRQDATGSVFSPADFVTNWNDLSERAKGVLFQGDHRKAIDDIVRVAAGMKASGKFANTSKTGIAIGATGTIGTFMANPVLATLGIAGQFGAGKLLGSPRFARWLSSLGRKPNPSAVKDHVRSLSAVARAEPAIANNVLDLQARLRDTFTVPPMRAAADESGGDPSVVNGSAGENQSQYEDAQP